MRTALQSKLCALKYLLLGTRSQVLEVVKADVSRGSSSCLATFAHFDPESKIEQPTVFYIEQLHNQINSEIIFITTSPKLLPEEYEKIKPYCSLIIHRKNIAFDFGSWKTALDYIGGIKDYERLILANSSVYGPMGDLNNVVSLLDPYEKIPAMIGITDSFEDKYHLQSYFLCFNRPAFSSKEFKKFWNNFQWVNDKGFVIMRCEVGLSQRMLSAGVKLMPFCRYEEAQKAFLKRNGRKPLQGYEGKPMNPMLFYYRELIDDLKCPFIKSSIFKKMHQREEEHAFSANNFIKSYNISGCCLKKRDC